MRNLSSKGSLASLMPLFSECMNAFLTWYKSHAFKKTQSLHPTLAMCACVCLWEKHSTIPEVNEILT